MPTREEMIAALKQGQSANPSRAEMIAALKSAPQPEPSLLDEQVPIVGGTPRGYIQGTLNVLPTAGMVAGGALGGAAGIPAAGPFGATAGGIAGAGIGGGAGAALKNLGEQYILGKDKTRADVYGDPASAAVDSMTNELGGQVLGKAGSLAAASSKGQATIAALSKLAQKGEDIVTHPVVRSIAPLFEMQHGPIATAATILGTTPQVLEGAGGLAKDVLSTQAGQALATKGAIEAQRKFSPWDQAK